MFRPNLRIVLTKNFIKSTLFNKNKKTYKENVIKNKHNLMNVRRYHSGSPNNPKPNDNIPIFIMLGMVGILSIINRRGPDGGGIGIIAL